MASIDEDLQRGLVALQGQDPLTAERRFRQVLKKEPRHLGALNLLAIVLIQLGRFEDAETYAKRAASMTPANDATLSNYGYILLAQSRPADALEQFDKALAVNQANPDTWHNRGTALGDLKRREDALASFDKAISINPGRPDTWVARGNILYQLGRPAESLAACDHALTLAPNHPDAIARAGNALTRLERREEAVAAFRSAIALHSGLAVAWFGMAIVLSELRRYAEAVQAYDKALAINPRIPFARGSRLHSKQLICDWSDFETECRELLAEVRSGAPASWPFTMLGIDSTPVDQLQCARAFLAQNVSATSTPLWRGERYGHDRVRVAYLSADFHEHPTARLAAGVFETHDHSRFETFAFSFGTEPDDAMRQRLTAAFEHWHDVRACSDGEIAALIRQAEIDIAVDLKGFTLGMRLGIFPHRCAPVQVSWLGYPGTMGAPYVDAILADAIVIPEGEEGFYSERVIRLPDTYQPNDRKRQIASHSPTRAEAGLPERGFVFCCFNDVYKITPEIFDVWMRLLQTVDGSVLWLFQANDAAPRNLAREATKRGVDPARLVFAARVPPADHLARHRLADLFLDTLPYGAHTTASDALWAGLPLVTCKGATFAGRVGASLLNATGLPELITTSLDSYETLALRLARGPQLLASIRAKLAANRLSYPLFDTARFTRNLERALLAMARRS